MGMVFQSFNLFPHKSVLENLTIGPVNVKKADKKEWKERLNEKRAANKAARDEIITAGSIEELIQRIDEYNFNYRADTVQTEAEKYVGTTIDFKG